MINRDSLTLKNGLLKYSSKGPLNRHFTASKLDALKLDLEVVSDAYRVLNGPVASCEPFGVAHLESDLGKNLRGRGSITKKTIAWLMLVKHLVDKDLLTFDMSTSNNYYGQVRLKIKDKQEQQQRSFF